jgi:branched-subunit amino acid ABC-type transport system permease component
MNLIASIAGVLFDGVAYGSLLFLISIGLSVTIGLMNFINLAHGAFSMLSGYVCVTIMSRWGAPFLVSVPLAFIAAAGVNFVAGAFSGDPNGTAEILAQAIRHPGFSFVEILSPCMTFRPEQREWKHQAHPAPVAETDDPARAARRIMTDDGINIGVLHACDRSP